MLEAPPNITIIGLGKLGHKVADILASKGLMVTGIRRSAVSSGEFTVVSADATDPLSLAGALPEHNDIVVVILTPQGRDAVSYKKAYVDSAEVITQVLKEKESQPRQIIFVSSTSVYNQQNSEVVSEASATEPTRETAKLLLEAESVYRDCGIPSTLVRFAGIYGPGRYRLIMQAEKGEIPSPSPELYTNRIHEDDCVGFLVHLVTKSLAGDVLEPVYIGCDSTPVPMHDLLMWMRESLGLEPVSEFSVNTSPLRQSKRCSNALMLASGYQFRYPGYQEGYGSLLDDYRRTTSN